MLKNIPFIVLLCLAIALPPRLATADPGTVAAVSFLASSVLSLFDSGASVTAAEVSQIRTMLETLHQRLEHYDKALGRILEKLDDMPEIMRTELEHALDRDHGYALLATIELIVEDVRIIEKGEIPIANPQSRLSNLQQASRNMMQRSDLNLPYFIAALRTERAFIKAIGGSEPRRIADWEERRETYRQRLQRVFLHPEYVPHLRHYLDPENTPEPETMPYTDDPLSEVDGFEIQDPENTPLLLKMAYDLEQQLKNQMLRLRREYEALPSAEKPHRVVDCSAARLQIVNERAEKMANSLTTRRRDVDIRQMLLVMYDDMVEHAIVTWMNLVNEWRVSNGQEPEEVPDIKRFSVSPPGSLMSNRHAQRDQLWIFRVHELDERERNLHLRDMDEISSKRHKRTIYSDIFEWDAKRIQDYAESYPYEYKFTDMFHLVKAVCEKLDIDKFIRFFNKNCGLSLFLSYKNLCR